MEYYKSNAIYEHIINQNVIQYKFVVGNAWQLVYGDNNCMPKLLVYAEGVKDTDIENELLDNSKYAFGLLKTLTDKANLPLIFIKFPSNIDEVDYVLVADDPKNLTFKKVNMSELSDIYKNHGLPITNSTTAKYLNDRTSSAYHNWQRGSLGSQITVSDIDLWKVNDKGEPVEIYELKRSYYSLERWKPFTDDYRNFQLIDNLCRMCGISFRILYNVRLKNPFREIIDPLKIFSVNFTQNPPIQGGNIISLNGFNNL